MENQIILNQYTIGNLEATLSEIPPSKISSKSLPEILFSSKAKTLKATVKQLLDEIELRKTLHADLINRINYDSRQCGNLLEEITLLTRNNYLIERAVDFSSRRTQIEVQIIDLEKEKRQEDLVFWKDIATLKKYLMIALADYWDIARKNKLLNLENETIKGDRTTMPKTQTDYW